MKAVLFSSSRLREPSLIERFDYYQKLLRTRLPIDRRLVKKGLLTAHVPNGWRTIALDEHGESLTSKQFAARIGQWRRDNCPGLAFLIGAADGLDRTDLAQATDTLRLSTFTLPHQLCFVVLAEQIYRATGINRGDSYHRE
jgi:23S rRNA (pseudouridine1915-N3)-methyltransferase